MYLPARLFRFRASSSPKPPTGVDVWVNEVVINDLEVRPLGLDSIEFDDEGTVSLSFVAITPGQYDIRIRGTTGDTQRAAFVIE